MSAIEDSMNKILEHHGVKGMHWGVRRSRGPDGHVKGPSKKSSGHESSEDSKQAEASKAKVKAAGGHHVLSNQELEQLNKRMNLEQQATKLSSGTSNKGAKFAKDLLVNTGKSQIQTIANQGASKAIAALLK